MLYDIVIDLATEYRDVCNAESVQYINITDERAAELIIPLFVKTICFKGQLSAYTIPDHIEEFTAFDVGLKELYVNDNLKWLNCCYNNLKSIELPEGIEVVDLNNNELETITARKQLNKIKVLSIKNNKIEKLDLLLPSTMESFWIAGNVGIRIRHMGFVFIDDEYGNVMSLIEGDYKHILGNGILARSLYVQHTVAQHCYTGKKYIDLNEYYD